MPTKIVNSVNSGELSPLMKGRTDFARYYNAAQLLQNNIPLAQGGYEKRAGTQFIKEVKTSSLKTRLIPFVYNVSTVYQIEAGNLYFRFFRAGVAIGAPTEVVTPYLTADLAGLKFVQSADVMYIVHPSYKPRKLKRTSASDETLWTLTEVDNTNGPFMTVNLDETLTITPSYPAWVTATSYTKDDIVVIAGTAKNPIDYSSQTIDNAAVTDNGDGTVDIADTGHLYTAGMGITIAGTTNYDGDYIVQTGTTANLIRIIATFVAETPAGTETVERKEVSIDNGGGLTGIGSTAHGFVEGDRITIAGSTSHNGTYEVHETVTTNQIVIVKEFVLEYFTGAETITQSTYYKALTTHTSGAGNPTPPGNITDWALALTFTGTNLILTSSSAFFTADHIGALFKITHDRTDSAYSGNFTVNPGKSPNFIVSKGTDWSLITSGTWGGVLEVQRSYDGGATYQVWKKYTSAAATPQNFNVSGTEEKDNAIYRIATPSNMAGNCIYDFNIDEFETDGIVKVTAFTSTTIVTATVITNLGNVLTTDNWCEGAWSDERGYPSTVKFYDERIIYAGSTFLPATVWTSKADDLDNFDAGILDDDAVIRRLDGDQINKIQWIESLEDILIGTAGGSWRMGSSDRTEPMSATNITHRRQNSSGSADISSVELNNTILFTAFKGKSIIDLFFSGDTNGYQTRDLNKMASHLTESTTIVELALMKHPEQILWCLLDSGVLLGLLYRVEEELLGWFRFVTDGVIESITVTPGTTEDDLTMIVNRTIGGATKRYIETKKPQDYGFTDVTGAWYVDSALETDAGAAATITHITNANPAVVTATAHGYSNTDKVRIIGVLGTANANSVFEIANVAANTFSLKDPDTSVDIDSLLWGVYISGGTAEKVSKTYSNLTHLEGETVAILADGAAVATKTVSSGAITLDDYANRVIAGLPYTSIFQPFPPDFDGGRLQGRINRVSKMILNFYRTAGVKIGRTLDALDEVFLFNEDLIMDDKVALFSGDYLHEFDGVWDRDNDIYIVSDEPLPMTFIAMIYEIERSSV